MTDTALPTGPTVTAGPARDPVTALLFAVAIFTSAALVFAMQPMVTKLVLPMLGGSPSVWNTAMVFFQAALLAGYAYAHALQRVRSIRVQVGIHLALLSTAAVFLPLTISGALGDPDPAAPIAWLLATLALSVGAPFAVLSATAPLLQAWYARVRAGHEDGKNPYVLYAASNLGSFLSLLSYPVLIEPLTTLSGQRIGWSLGYGLFVLMVVGLAVTVWRRRVADRSEIAPLERTPPMPWARKGVLILLAAAPSSLMLGVTAYLSTDVASAPFLWVLPLALYLLTFVIAFQTRPPIPLAVTMVVAGGLAAVTVALLAFRTGEWALIFGLHLVTFFFVTLMCHQVLAEKRPGPDRLTEFYLLMSFGGVVGGAFTALLAPVIFQTIWEYPLVLVLAGLARRWGTEEVQKREVLLFMGGLALAAVPPLMLEVIRFNPEVGALFPSSQTMILSAQYALCIAALFAFLVRDRAIFYTIILAAVAVSSHHMARGYNWSLTERSFFGVMRVATTQDSRLGGDVRVLMHGTTLHGAQPVSPAFACSPTLYYAPQTPIGQATGVIQARTATANIGVVGQGSGAMAGFKRAGDTMTFFEIDPMVDRMSRDRQWFSFISDCADGPVRTVLGDARLTLEDELAGSYDLLLIDAFSSDAVPTHLLTQEAIAGYLRLVKPDGVVVLHLSNRNLDITRPAVAAAWALGVPDLHQIYIESPDRADMSEASTEALILSPTEVGLAEFRADPRWRRVDPGEVRPWTDDYVNLFGSLVRSIRNRG